MSLSVEEIDARLKGRREAQHESLERMREIKDHYNGDVAVFLPEMDRNEKPAVANLIAEGIDQLAMRVASTLPNVYYPALDPRKESGVRSREYANIRRMANMAWWQMSRMKTIQRRRARFLVAYGAAACVIRPDFKNEVPRWHLRDPLNTYPNPTEHYDDDSPVDCIFTFSKSFGWLAKHYEDRIGRLSVGTDPSHDDMFELVEYIDCDEIVLAVRGKKQDADYYYNFERGKEIVELERVPNRAGVCTAVVPNRVTLDRVYGQFNQAIGMLQGQAKLMALDLIAVEKSVFPDLAVFGTGGAVPQLMGDEWVDGRTGGVNIIHNGDVKAVNLVPGFQVGEAMDRLERGVRQVGVPAQFGGENPTNIRTGRLGEITMSAHVDFRIQEYQEQLAQALMSENWRAVEVAKAYFGEKPKTFHVYMAKAKGQVDYIPEKHFESTHNVVSYPMPGSDVNAAIIGIGQRLGVGLMSRRQAMWADPLVDDPEAMYDEVMTEELERALMESLKQAAVAGALPPGDLANIQRKVFDQNMSLAQAVEEAQAEAQERQATEVPPGSPETQPGLAQPGMGAEAPPSVEEPPRGATNMRQLLYALRQPDSVSGGAAPPLHAGAGS